MVNEEMYIPIVLFICLAVIFGLFLMFRYRTRADMQKTVRSALDKGQELTPELVERLGQPKPMPHADLRRALIWIAVGVGFALFGFILDEDDAVRPLIAIGTFPVVIGIAYLILSRFSEKDTST
jgi:Domain of unknown function (DUF6249)